MRRSLWLCSLCVLALAVPPLAAERQWDHGRLDGTVFYEIFVRSFADGDGDGIGDLGGLIERLDYLNDGDASSGEDLGVGGIWLMPIFPSPSYHGYDVSDYRGIQPDYGTPSDFDRLLAEADRRGLAVILDLVINHTSVDHPWFRNAAAGGRLRDVYVWNETNPGWTQPWGGSNGTWHPNPLGPGYYYGLFWSGMPDLNFRNSRLQRKILQVAGNWLKRGVAGFRLDAARYLVAAGDGAAQADRPETHAFWRRFSRRLRTRFPRALAVGESWADTSTIAGYYGSSEVVTGGDELPLNFNFPLAEAILRALETGRHDPVTRVLTEMATHYPAGARDAPFLGNHDQDRIASRLAGDPGRLRAAATILLTLPGVPFLYYGEEIGLANGAGPGDEAKRTPMPWDGSENAGFSPATPWYPLAAGHRQVNVAAASNDPDSLLSHYRRLIRARGSTPALAAGALESVESPRGVLLFARWTELDRVLVAINLTGAFASLAIAEPRPAGEVILADGGQLSGGPGAWTMNLKPFGSAIYRFPPAR